MRLFAPFLLVAATLIHDTLARGPGDRFKELRERYQAPAVNYPRSVGNSSAPSKFLNDKTKKFYIDGRSIPEVDFDVGESYAGLLPISSDPKEERQLYFWFFPSENPKASDEITIWLNGGPGCSSLTGLVQENGPFLWQSGTFKPVPNPYSWNRLTNMIWVEQPVGTGFSTGTPNITSEAQLAEQFKGFFKNFVDTFSLHNRKVFITGESYAGNYVPYIADAFLSTKDKKYFDVHGIMINDPSINSYAIMNDVPAMTYHDNWKLMFGLDDKQVDNLKSIDKKCGWTAYMNQHLVFPPKGKLPAPPQITDECDLYDTMFNYATQVNPCFNVYQITSTCPLLWDVLGFPGSNPYTSKGATIYFARPDVQKAIHVPLGTNWTECSNGNVFNTNTGLDDETNNGIYSSYTVLPRVIDQVERTVIGHGNLDFVLLGNGTLLTIQNMTWGGMQGFQKPVTDNLFVPFHNESSVSTQTAAGFMGKTRTERKLTFVEVNLSGHMIPQYQPSAAFRKIEFLLGRISSLSSNEPFTVDISQSGLPSQKPRLGLHVDKARFHRPT